MHIYTRKMYIILKVENIYLTLYSHRCVILIKAMKKKGNDGAHPARFGAITAPLRATPAGLGDIFLLGDPYGGAQRRFLRGSWRPRTSLLA